VTLRGRCIVDQIKQKILGSGLSGFGVEQLTAMTSNLFVKGAAPLSMPPR
jgi:hypothetical protein